MQQRERTLQPKTSGTLSIVTSFSVVASGSRSGSGKSGKKPGRRVEDGCAPPWSPTGALIRLFSRKREDQTVHSSVGERPSTKSLRKVRSDAAVNRGKSDQEEGYRSHEDISTSPRPPGLQRTPTRETLARFVWPPRGSKHPSPRPARRSHRPPMLDSTSPAFRNDDDPGCLSAAALTRTDSPISNASPVEFFFPQSRPAGPATRYQRVTTGVDEPCVAEPEPRVLGRSATVLDARSGTKAARILLGGAPGPAGSCFSDDGRAGYARRRSSISVPRELGGGALGDAAVPCKLQHKLHKRSRSGSARWSTPNTSRKGLLDAGTLPREPALQDLPPTNMQNPTLRLAVYSRPSDDTLAFEWDTEPQSAEPSAPDWTGEWNVGDLQQVIGALRTLRCVDITEYDQALLCSGASGLYNYSRSEGSVGMLQSRV
ncbi:unnamed protein product [Mycena citricolor]|uniref:Uncharacterized protein n=1 Tax=Mycena citricolor TaxID=2018698 RepID=A0AAD2H6H3_9AGAR|nr:unnamed protein product [Mycena citricolor]